MAAAVIIFAIVAVLAVILIAYFMWSSKSTAPAATCNGCTSSQTCVSGKCQDNTACGGSPCPPGSTCQNGACAPQPCTPACTGSENCESGVCKGAATCTKPGDCGGGQTCANGLCVAASCTESGSCGSGYFCNNGQCVADQCPAMDCAGKSCVNSQCVDCTSTSCGTGQSCIAGYCVSSTCSANAPCTGPAGAFSCVSGSCVQNLCTSASAHCTNGQYCNSVGMCQAIKACNTSMDCGNAALACYQGACLPSCDPDKTNTCDAGLSCVPVDPQNFYSGMSGVCVACSTDSTQCNIPNDIVCQSSQDCPTTLTCTNNVCVPPASQPVTVCNIDGAADQCSPGYYCKSGTCTAHTNRDVLQWWPIDLSASPPSTYTKGSPVPMSMLYEAATGPKQGQPYAMGFKSAEDQDGIQIQMIPVVFRISGTNAPGRALFGFFDFASYSFNTSDLGNWWIFKASGPAQQWHWSAPAIDYTNCNVTEAAYVTTGVNGLMEFPVKDPNGPAINDQYFTYKGFPLCYNATGGWAGNVNEANTADSPSLFTAKVNMSESGYTTPCVAFADNWGYGSQQSNYYTIAEQPLYRSYRY